MQNMPKEVVDALLEARRQFHMISGYVTREDYADYGSRLGVAIDCSSYAENLKSVLERFFFKSGLPPLDKCWERK